jgi:hypothetical protein
MTSDNKVCAKIMMRLSLLNLEPEMEKETFDIMRELSTPGGPTEGCFLRMTSTDYHTDTKPRPHELEHMPDVCRPYFPALTRTAPPDA